MCRFVYGGNFSDQWTSFPSNYIDDMSQFEDILDSFKPLLLFIYAFLYITVL